MMLLAILVLLAGKCNNFLCTQYNTHTHMWYVSNDLWAEVCCNKFIFLGKFRGSDQSQSRGCAKLWVELRCSTQQLQLISTLAIATSQHQLHLFADFSLLSIKLQIRFENWESTGSQFKVQFRVQFKIKFSESSNIKYHKIIVLTKVSSVFSLVEDFRRIFLFLQKLGY